MAEPFDDVTPSITFSSPEEQERPLSPRSNQDIENLYASPLSSRRTHQAVGAIKEEEEVFTESKQESEEEKRLIDWSTNVFVPTCISLLEQCSKGDMNKVQTYLRLLSNSITFFCNEHQSITSFSPSRSTSDLLEATSRETTPSRETSYIKPSGRNTSPSRDENESDTSVAIKVLRSVSTSLLSPLQDQCSKQELTDEIYRNIITAIQKISWKVEAFLSYTNITHDELNIHKRIFEGVFDIKITKMMTAVPPEEHKIQNSPSHISKISARNPHLSPLRYYSSLGSVKTRAVRDNTSVSPSLSPTHEDVDDDYFRPKAPRRTTVSISKLQVHNLGLNMVDMTNLSDNHPLTRSNTIGMNTAAMLVQDEGAQKLEAVRNKVLKKLAKEFPHLATETTDSERVKIKPPALLPLNDITSNNDVLSFASTPLTLSPIESPIKGTSSPISTNFLYDNDDNESNLTSQKDFSKSLDELVGVQSPEHKSKPSSLSAVSLRKVSEPTSKKLLNHTHTLPSKRRGTIMTMFKGKKAKSFGHGDRIKQRPFIQPRGKTNSSEFFSDENEDPERNISSSIEWYSRGARPSMSSSRDSFYLNIEVLHKNLQSPRRRRFSMSGSKRHSLYMVDINVTTNSPEFELQEYTITRSYKDTTALYDILSNSTTSTHELPERPDKKSKDWKQQVESFLVQVSNSPELRGITEFIEFMRPGEMSAVLANSIHKDSEYELLMTFYTPLTYPEGEAGSHLEVELIKSNEAAHPSLSSRPRLDYYVNTIKGSVLVEKQEGEEETTFIIREGDKDALIICETQDGCLVVAGTFEKLVEQLACEEKPDHNYVHTFLLGYRHFGSSVDFISLLIKRFQMNVAPDASDEEIAYAEKWKYVIQLRVLDIIQCWLKSCFPDFMLYPEALLKLKEFIDQLNQTNDDNFTSAANKFSSIIGHKIDIYQNRKSTLRLSTTSSSSHSPSLSPVHHSSSFTRQTSKPDVNSFTAIQLARQLTLMEIDYLKAIDVYELAVYIWENSDDSKEYRKNLDAYIARFNKVSYWVASEVLSIDEDKGRAVLIEKFIDMAKHCQELKNFNITVSVVTGLSLSCIRRLSKTWKLVNERLTKSFEKLKLLVNPANNHHDYRKIINTVSGSDRCIPYFGVFMRDVTLCNYGNPKKLKNGLYNFSKLRILVQMFEEIYQYQRSKHFYPSDDRTQVFCANLSSLEEHDLYELSLKLEPRELSVCDSD